MTNILWQQDIQKQLCQLRDRFNGYEGDSYNEDEFHFLNLTASLITTKGCINTELRRYQEGCHYYKTTNKTGPVREKIKSIKCY